MIAQLRVYIAYTDMDELSLRMSQRSTTKWRERKKGCGQTKDAECV